MTRNKLIGLLFISVITLSSFVACNKSGSGAGGTKRPVFAVVPKGVSHDFWKSVEAGAQAAAKELEVEVIWRGPEKETDYAGQMNMVEDFINRRVDGIALAPSSGEALKPVVEKAKREGIPMTIFDSGINSESYISYVSTDNRKGGEVAGERMGEKLGGKGRVAIIGVRKGSVSTDEREEGFAAKLKEKFPGIEVVDHRYGEASFATSLNVATDILTRFPDLTGIFASNESSAVGAARALENKGMAGKVLLVGFDASETLVEGLNKGTIDSLVVQDPYKMGYESVKTLYQHLNKQPVERRIDTGVKLVTKENLNTPEVQTLIKGPQKQASADGGKK